MAVEVRTHSQDGAIGAAPLLDLDPELGRGLSRQQRADARRELVARTTLLQPGQSGDELFRSGLFAALVIEGALARRVSTERGRSLEVVVKGDLLRPWQEDSGWVVDSAAGAASEPMAASRSRCR